MFTPTGHVSLLLSERELKGYFCKGQQSGHAPEQLCSVKYNPDEKLLSHIENAVYDNPSLLEDQRVRVLIDTDQLLLFPPDTDHQLICQAMERVYATRREDVFISEDDHVITAFTLCAGLKPFLARTFAGAMVECVLDVLRREFSGRRGASVQVYADLNDGHLTLLAFRDRHLVHGSVHPYREPADAAYFIYALWRQLGLNADQGEINVSGNKSHRSELMTILRRRLNYVMLTLLPRLEGTEEVAAAILLDSQNTMTHEDNTR